MLVFLTGCHNSPAPRDKLIFKDENAMRSTLRGTWILQEYADSIEAGWTPKLLEYMLEHRNCIKYDMAQMRTASFYNGVPDTSNPVNNTLIANGLSSGPGENQVVLMTKGSDANESDTAELLAEEGDTILRLHKDSIKQDFVKYDNSQCPEIAVYNHLVNSKFIAGKYFRLNDGTREHHIIFTRCGNVEGAEFIDAALRDNTQYEVNLTNFYTDPDALQFYNPKYKMGRSYYWEVSEDSLILSRDNSFGEDRIVLIKAQ